MDQINLLMQCAGLGDQILGLVASAGCKAANPDREIVYCSHHHDWTSLWHGYDRLAAPTSMFARHLNAHYDLECRSKCSNGTKPRWRRYCENAGHVEPVAPTLRQETELRAYASEYRGCVVLAPFSAYRNRSIPVLNAVEIERLLTQAGHRVVIVHNRHSDLNRFTSELVYGKEPAFVSSLLLNAALTIGCDSGLSHVSSMMHPYGTKTLVISGPTDPRMIFFHPVHTVKSPLACAGCFWQPRHGGIVGYSHRCDTACQAMVDIAPQDVANLAQSLLSNVDAE